MTWMMMTLTLISNINTHAQVKEIQRKEKHTTAQYVFKNEANNRQSKKTKKFERDMENKNGETK
jgi:hypothetical protein